MPQPGAAVPRPLFFYHVPKTGGTTFYVAMMYALNLGWRPDWTRQSLGRFDSGPEVFGDSPATARNLPAGAIFAASHNCYGFHLLFRQLFLLATIQRDPFRRVLSSYTYECMRANRRSTAAEFEQFIRRPENRNVAVRQIAGRWPRPAAGEAGAAAQAIERLEGEFHAYVTADDIGPLLTHYLSAFGVPSVLIANVNRTLPEYRIDGQPYRDEIHELNAEDHALFEFVRDHPRLPATPPAALHSRTIYVREPGQRAQSVSEGQIADTADFLRNLERDHRFWLGTG